MTKRVQKVLVHDFSGHPFQVQLARNLARRGYTATHFFCPSFQTPKGSVGDRNLDDGFRSKPIALWRPFAKYSAPQRLLQELEYGVRVGVATVRERPDVVITANTPLIAAFVYQLILLMWRFPVVFWQQDVYSVAMAGHLERSAGLPGRVVGRALVRLEKWLLRSSRHVVVISEDFVDTLSQWDADLVAVSVVENWAPLEELPRSTRPSVWSKENRIEDDEIIFLYAGSLGLKHEPSILLDLARSFSPEDNARVVVASEGRGANWLEREAKPEDPILLLPFQEFDAMPDMLATADVLMALLEPDAGAFSVPSKVLTYHCAGRPILGAIPKENLATRIIEENKSGMVVQPGDAQAFVAAARRLIREPELRTSCGDASRAYAERAFDIEAITDSFEGILGAATAQER